MNLKNYHIDKSWTLFLDRDGVINRRLPGDYVKSWEEFEFLPGVKESLAKLSGIFGRIIIVTNQQGIGKGLMTEEGLKEIHQKMITEVEAAGGRIDAVYHCPGLAKDNPPCRKPNPGMGLQAQQDFPEIVFNKSVMVGDSPSDMEFGTSLGMNCLYVGEEKIISLKQYKSIDKLQGIFEYLNG